jgi:hypothetical protein
LAAAAAVVSTLVGAPVSSAATSGTGRTPLRVSVQSMTPSVIPRTGRVTLTGLITNRSQQVWTDLQAYLVTSATPIQSREELARQAATPAASQVGKRVTSAGLFESVGDLAPGQSVSFRLSVRREDLGISGAPGVYWVGVHVLGALDGVRDTVADGRARTFMPLLPSNAASTGTRTRMALLVPVEAPVQRGADTRLLRLAAWQRTLQTDGRLDRLLNLSARATEPITWVVDPAVLDAARSVAQDNPALSSGPDGSGGSVGSGGSGGSGQSGSSPSASPSPSPSSSPSADTGGGATDESSTDRSAAAVSARAWLSEFSRQALTHTVAAVPYGDLDVASVFDRSRGNAYRKATALSRRTMEDFDVPGPLPVVAPTSGYLPASALKSISSDSTVVLGAGAVPQSDNPADNTVFERPGRAPIVLADPTAGAGGPRPGGRFSALAVRQRLLSDAALHAMSADRDRVLVVSTPEYWNPGPAWSESDFFAGLDQPWLRMVDLPGVVAEAGNAGEATTVYPRAERANELPTENLRSTRALSRVGRTFAELLSANDSVDDILARVAMLASSQNARSNPVRARAQAALTAGYVRSQLRRVHIEGPSFVMMSGESGLVQITVVNDLDQPVTVGIRSQTSSPDLKIDQVDPITLGPGRRNSLRLEARSRDIGVHPVTMVATTADGTPIGSRTQFTVRTSNVSTVIWFIMVVGGGLLFLAIVIRLIRRIRRRKSTHGPLLHRDRTSPPSQPSNQELNA